MSVEGNARHQSRGMWILLVFPLLGVVMALVTLFGPRHSGSRGAIAPTSVPAGAVEGRPAPNFEGITPDGETFTLSELRGRPLAINFWATWCAPCRAEMPVLQEAQDRYAATGFLVLAVNASEPVAEIEAFVGELGLNFLILLDPQGAISESYSVRAYPTTMWVDADGILRAKHLGPLTLTDVNRYMAEVLASGAE